jgi:hypothetical protein
MIENPFRSKQRLDLQTLQQEVLSVVARYDFSVGYYKETISLLSELELGEEYRTLPYNRPFHTGMSYKSYPYIAKIVDSFQSEKTGLMLQCREPHSSYGLHIDAMGEGLGSRRFNLPVFSRKGSYLCIIDSNDVPEAWFENNVAFIPDLLGLFKDKLFIYYLEPGYLYSFRFDKFHTVINSTSEFRYSLLLDFNETDFVQRFLINEMTIQLQSLPHGMFA